LAFSDPLQLALATQIRLELGELQEAVAGGRAGVDRSVAFSAAPRARTVRRLARGHVNFPSLPTMSWNLPRLIQRWSLAQ